MKRIGLSVGVGISLQTRPRHRYKRRQLWFPLTKAVDWWDAEFHDLMLHDSVRMTAFKDAIFSVVGRFGRQRNSRGEPIRILDVGTGFGILAQWAAQAARQNDLPARIYAVEANPVTAAQAASELSKKKFLWQPTRHPGDILLFNQISYHLPQAMAESRRIVAEFDPGLWEHYLRRGNFKLFDLIVSETLGGLGDNEDCVAILDDAVKSFLREPGGHVIPCHVTTYLAPVTRPRIGGDADLHDAVATQHVRMLNKRYEAEYRRLLAAEGSPFNLFYDAIIPSSDYLAAKAQIHVWSFPSGDVSDKRVDYEEQRTFVAETDGTLIGFKGFFRAVLADADGADAETVLDIEPDDIEHRLTSDCWKHQYLPVDSPLPVTLGDEISLTFLRKQESVGNGFTYQWIGEVRPVADGLRGLRFDQSHRCEIAFHRPRPPLLANLVRTSAIAAELVHLESQVLPEDATEARKILNNVRDGTIDSDFASYQARDALAISLHMQDRRKHLLDDLGRRGRDRRLQGIRLSLPTRQRDLVWFPEEPTDQESRDGYILRYQAYGAPTNAEDVAAVVEGGDSEGADSRQPIFESCLILPLPTYANLSWAERSELKGVMFLFQLRIFMEILLADLRKSVQLALPALAHEMKGLMVGMSKMWVFEPTSEVEQAVKDSIPGLLDSDRLALSKMRLLVTPAQEFFITFGRLLSLWTFTPEWRKVFPGSTPPRLVSDWISAVWQLAIDTVKLTVCEGLEVSAPNGMTTIAQRQDYATGALAKALRSGAVNGADGGDPVVPWHEDVCAQWLALTRWLLCASLNYVRHGKICADCLGIETSLDSTSLILTVRNSRRPPQHDLPDWWPSNENTTGRDIPRRLGMKGSQVLREVLRQINPIVA